MKKPHNQTRMPDEQVIAFLEEVLIEQGYMLPREAEHITSEDLALYGKGTPQPLDVLRRSFESLTRKQSAVATTQPEVSESLAMAARKGAAISDTVRRRMREDRDNVEAERERHD